MNGWEILDKVRSVQDTRACATFLVHASSPLLRQHLERNKRENLKNVYHFLFQRERRLAKQKISFVVGVTTFTQLTICSIIIISF